MGKLNDLERQIESLSEDELSSFREWFARFDANAWDRKFEIDVKAGKLDALADRARKSHGTGESSEL